MHVPVTVLAVLVVGSNVMEAESIWSTMPASGGNMLRDAYPIGNGRMGAMSLGPPGQDKLSLNVDTLWNSGPFEATVWHAVVFVSSNLLTRRVVLQWW